MQYMLLIYDNEKIREGMNEADRGKLFADYMALTASLKQSGNWLAGGGLQPVRTATSVQVRDGKRLTTDGPFAETKEQLAGYYLVQAKDLDEALAIAVRIPSAKIGTVEVRPLMQM